MTTAAQVVGGLLMVTAAAIRGLWRYGWRVVFRAGWL